MQTKEEILQSVSNSGFIIEESLELKNINSTAYKMCHKKSGARLIYLNTDDKENLFSVAFKTPPTDDTGLPHILEHTVLAGSKRYPLKDPFVELLKTSVATFLNAMTYPDKTVYPCASMNEQDFYNIMRVYCDAVFFPLITKEHFQQEGYHYEFSELDDPKSDLTIKGVVYNEMKGVYSDLNGIIGKEEAKSIFPDNAYGKDSGGDPDFISTLTYEDFKNFHKLYYHPSNAYIFVYGNFPIGNTLKILDEEYLSKFEKITVNTEIKKQANFSAPNEKIINYPIPANEEKKQKTAITINFKTNDLTDTLETLAMTVIEHYMLGNAASPLRKALVDSKLGESLTSSGYGDYQRDTYFTIGLKGTKKKRKEQILELVFNVCKNEIENGFDKDKLTAAFHKQEFSAKEITNSYPITIMDRIYNYWLYGADPYTLLNLNSHIETLKNKYKSEPKYFEKILEKYILKNKNYSVLIFKADNKYNKKKAKLFKTKMDNIKTNLPEIKINEIVETSKKLQVFQSSKDTEESLNSLPKLAIKNISKEPVKFPSTIDKVNDRPFITTDIFNNGINYITLAFDLRGLDESLLDYLPIYKLAILRMGAGKYDYLELAELETLYTGGVSAGLYTDGNFNDPNDFLPLLKISSKATEENSQKMLNLLWEKIKHCRFENKKRLKDILIQKKSALRTNILSSGTTFAIYYANRNISLNHNLNDRFTGINHIRFISDITDNFEENYDKIIHNLKRIQKFIMNKNRLYFSYIGKDSQKSKAINWTNNFSNSLTSDIITNQNYNFKPSYNNSEAICLSAEVAYNALSFPAVAATNKHAPALFILGQYLSFNYLWNKIRVENGAYGAHSFFSTLGGVFGLSTYRDPHIIKSFNTFYKCIDHILNDMDHDKNAIEQNIIGSLKKLDRPVRPGNAVNLALSKYLRNITDESRYEFRQNLLSLTYNKIKEATVEVLEHGYKQASICSITNKRNIKKANSKDSNFKFKIEYL
jgi:presequence protease